MFKNKTLWRKAAPPHGPRTTKVASNNNNHDSNIGTRDDAREELRHRGTRRGRRKRQEVGDTQTAPPQSLIPGGTSGSGMTSVARGASNGTYVVEVMVMVDVKMCEAFSYDSRQLEDYILHFWQAVVTIIIFVKCFVLTRQIFDIMCPVNKVPCLSINIW